MTCFECREVGHLTKDCKELVQMENALRIAGPPAQTQISPPRAGTFNMMMQDADQEADVVAGTFPVNLVEAKV